ncbi:MAG: iron-containing alcohol dehydrogenase, partial [Thermodesulfobacteriota bacterium]|nr:iron-containing alcohol dehydrogenase [Thermodesulfobacteriota bacterium]
ALCRTIIQATDKLRKNAQNYDARADLAWSATLALNGISGVGLAGGDWSAHFIEHGISALFPAVAHGSGLAVVFPAWILFMRNENPDTFSRWAQNVWNKDGVEDAVKSMRDKYQSWGAPVTLSELGASEKDVDGIADKVMEFAEEWHEARLKRLKDLGPDGVRAILRLAL